MKANPGKYRFFLSGSDSITVRIINETISCSKCEKLLGIKIDNNLHFKEHIKSLCKKASQKINTLSRLASLINFEQRILITNSFVIFFTFHIAQLCGCFTAENYMPASTDFMEGLHE